VNLKIKNRDHVLGNTVRRHVKVCNHRNVSGRSSGYEELTLLQFRHGRFPERERGMTRIGVANTASKVTVKVVAVTWSTSLQPEAPDDEPSALPARFRDRITVKFFYRTAVYSRSLAFLRPLYSIDRLSIVEAVASLVASPEDSGSGRHHTVDRTADPRSPYREGI
jgi:hypothetical protein